MEKGRDSSFRTKFRPSGLSFQGCVCFVIVFILSENEFLDYCRALKKKKKRIIEPK
jgi:hypothetical protein